MNINFDPETQINIDTIRIALQLTSIHREVKIERERERGYLVSASIFFSEQLFSFFNGASPFAFPYVFSMSVINSIICTKKESDAFAFSQVYGNK